MHIGKVSYYRRLKTRSEPELQSLYALLLQADFVLLSEMRGQLPPYYDQLRRRIKSEIEGMGLVADVGDLAESISQTMESWGAHAGSIRRMLTPLSSIEH